MTTRHHRVQIRLSRSHQRWVYGIGGLLLLSGIGWLVCHFFLAVQTEFGASPHPLEPWWLKLHGAAAMGFLIVIGSLLPNHIARAWRLRKNRSSGLAMLSLLAIIILSGYGLYYLGDEQTRPWISLIHWIIGLLVATVLPLHVWLGLKGKVRPLS
jgi:cation transport ATPase